MDELPESVTEDEVHVIVSEELAVEIFGVVVSEVTATIVFDLHPLLGSVIVKVYEPGAETTVTELVGAEPAGFPDTGPNHSYVPPAAFVPPLNVEEEIVQESEEDTLAITLGMSVLVPTDTNAEDSHALAGLLTVKVYTPAADTLVVELVGEEPAGIPAPGPVHEYVAPGVEEFPESVTDAETQVIVAVELAVEILGWVVLEDTDTTAELVQLFAGLVTVNV